ncbi:hypothetical protein niasHS_017828 [Heterodera schachtii]|uniref:Uncharacterized protein n=1 Tax=Heterodera schachtii TaxID=97005 RepID=A0ABD2HWZ2_HETSC
MEAEEIEQMWREQNASEHFEFIATLLEENGADGEEIVALLRENEQSLGILSNLLGGENMKKMWNNEKIRDKLLNRNFFDDTLRLLAHYRKVIDGQSKGDRIVNRIGADISVWMDWICRRMCSDQTDERSIGTDDRTAPPAGESAAKGRGKNCANWAAPGQKALFESLWLHFRLLYSECQYLATTIGDIKEKKQAEKKLTKLSIELSNFITGKENNGKT